MAISSSSVTNVSFTVVDEIFSIHFTICVTLSLMVLSPTDYFNEVIFVATNSTTLKKGGV